MTEQTSQFRDGDIAVFDHRSRASSGPHIGEWVTTRHVALRRNYGWKNHEWQVAIHGFWRVSDAFIAEHAIVIGNVNDYEPKATNE